MPPRMTVEAFLDYAAWLKQLDSVAATAVVQDVLDKVDLTSVRRRPLGKISGGQRRRAALGAALVASPSLLLLDEPTNGLDPIQRRRFLDLVRSIAPHTAVLMSTHLLEDVGLLANRWCAMRSGRLVAAGVIPRAGATEGTIEDIARAIAGDEIPR